MAINQKTIFKIFSVLKKIPYRTFFGMPARFKEISIVYTYYFNLKPIKVKNFLKLFLSSPKKYEKLGRKGVQRAIEDLKKIELFYKNYWSKLNDKEKIVFGFSLVHAYFASDRENFIYEVVIDGFPSGFNVEDFVPQNKLKVLEKVKKNCVKEYAGLDLYNILKKIMDGMREIILANKVIVKKKYQKEIEEIFKYKNFDELMKNSVLQLLYKYPGIFRFKQPIPKIFIKNIKYIAPSKKYFIFPIEKEKLGELKGLGVSPGEIKGKVIKAFSWVGDASKRIKKGQILVCPKTDPTWVPTLNRVSGVITEYGGLLSHAAIVSRELKIPCIVGVKNVLKILKDGDLIEMNGKSGEIKFLEKAK